MRRTIAVMFATLVLTACSGKFAAEQIPVLVPGQGDHWARRAGCIEGGVAGGDEQTALVRVTRVHGRPAVNDAAVQPGDTITVPRERLHLRADRESDAVRLCLLEGGVAELLDAVVQRHYGQPEADKTWQLRVPAMTLQQGHLLRALDVIELTGRAAASDSWEQAAKYYTGLAAELERDANGEFAARVYEHLATAASGDGPAGGADDAALRILRAAARGQDETEAVAILTAELVQWYSRTLWDAAVTERVPARERADRFDAIVAFGDALADFLTRKGTVTWNGKTAADLRAGFRETLVQRLAQGLRREIIAQYEARPIRSERQARKAFAAALREMEPYRAKLGMDILTRQDQEIFLAMARRGQDGPSGRDWTEHDRKIQLALLEGMLLARVTLPGRTDSMFGPVQFQITFDNYVPESGEFEGRVVWEDRGETRIRGRLLREELALEFSDLEATRRGELDLGEGSVYRFAFSSDMRRLVGRRSHPRIADSWFSAQISLKTRAAE